MIPLATTTVTILRTPTPSKYDEPYGGDSPSARTVVASGVRAVIDRPTGRTAMAGGEQSVVDLTLVCDRCDMDHRDLVRDDTSGVVYRLAWVLDYGSHMESGIRIVSGEV